MSNGKGTKLSSIRPDDDRFYIWTNIEGMCKPLMIDFVENDQVYIMNHVKKHNLFPYLKKIDGSMGFFLKQPNGFFKLPAKSTFRMMFCSRDYSILPEHEIPPNNRMLVKDEKGILVEICYWPDEFYNIKLGSKSIKNSQRSNVNTATTTPNNQILDFIKNSSFKIFFQ